MSEVVVSLKLSQGHVQACAPDDRLPVSLVPVSTGAGNMLEVREGGLFVAAPAKERMIIPWAIKWAGVTGKQHPDKMPIPPDLNGLYMLVAHATSVTHNNKTLFDANNFQLNRLVLRFENGKVVPPPQPVFWSISSSQNSWDGDNPPQQAAEAVFANGDIYYKNTNYNAANMRDLTLYMLIEKIAA